MLAELLEKTCFAEKRDGVTTSSSANQLAPTRLHEAISNLSPAYMRQAANLLAFPSIPLRRSLPNTNIFPCAHAEDLECAPFLFLPTA